MDILNNWTTQELFTGFLTTVLLTFGVSLICKCIRKMKSNNMQLEEEVPFSKEESCAALTEINKETDAVAMNDSSNTQDSRMIRERVEDVDRGFSSFENNGNQIKKKIVALIAPTQGVFFDNNAIMPPAAALPNSQSDSSRDRVVPIPIPQHVSGSSTADHRHEPVGAKYIPKKFYTEEFKGPFCFSVGIEGCIVDTPYCKVTIPAEAVMQSIQIKMTPIYYANENLTGRAFITPHIKFESEDEMVFEKDVEVAIYTSYAAANLNMPVAVQVRRVSGSRIVTNYRSVMLKNQEFIPFNTKVFCRFALHVGYEEMRNMIRNYYCAGYVQDEQAILRNRIVVALVYEDVPDTRTLNMQFLKTKKEVLGPVNFHVGYPSFLRVDIKKQTSVTINSPDETLNLNDNFGRKIDTKYYFRVAPNSRIQNANLSIQYKILISENCENFYPVVTKQCYLPWIVTAQLPEDAREPEFEPLPQQQLVNPDETPQIQVQESPAEQPISPQAAATPNNVQDNTEHGPESYDYIREAINVGQWWNQ